MNSFATNNNTVNKMSTINSIPLDGLDDARYTNADEVSLNDFLSQQIPLSPTTKKRDRHGDIRFNPSTSLPSTLETYGDNDELCSFLHKQIEKDDAVAASRFLASKSPTVMKQTSNTTQADGIANLFDEPALVTPPLTIKKVNDFKMVNIDGSTNGGDFDDVMMEAIEVLLLDNVGTHANSAVTEPIGLMQFMIDDGNQLDLVATDNLYVHSSTFQLHSDDRLKIRQIDRLHKRGMIANTPRNARILEACLAGAQLSLPTQKPAASKKGIDTDDDTLDIIVKKGFTTSNVFSLHKDTKLRLCQIERLQKHGLVANTTRNQQTLGRLASPDTDYLQPKITSPKLTSPRRRRRTSSSAMRKKNLKLIIPSIDLNEEVKAAEVAMNKTVASDNIKVELTTKVVDKKCLPNPIVSTGRSDATTNDSCRVNGEEKSKSPVASDDLLGPADVDDFYGTSGGDEPALLEEAV